CLTGFTCSGFLRTPTSKVTRLHIVTNMESRFPAKQVLWLGREFYKVKHGVTSATVMVPLTLATNFDHFGDLATNLATLATNR
ncbi:hypothetical protein AVEN_49620-1, partial [Araneus ventricosus]